MTQPKPPTNASAASALNILFADMSSLRSPCGFASGAWCEVQGHRVHAVAQPGRPRPVIEDVTQVRVTAPARYGGALHSQAVVTALHDVLLGDRLPEAGPAGAGIELGARVEQLRAAADAGIQSIGVILVIRAAEGWLGPLVARDGIGQQRQLLAPLRIGLPHARHTDGALALAIGGELLDGDGVTWRTGRLSCAYQWRTRREGAQGQCTCEERSAREATMVGVHGHSPSAKGKGVRLHAGVQEFDREGVLTLGVSLADELIEALLAHRSAAIGLHVHTAIRSRGMPVEGDAEVYRRNSGRAAEHQVQIACAEAEHDAGVRGG